MSVTSDDAGVPVLGGDDADLCPGDQVGEYVVDGKIGEGGFGTVFKATHPLIGKEVAVKVLARQYSAQAEMVRRFVAEARAVNQIRHRHIIDIFSFGQLEDGRHYYVMEFLAGEPLDEYLEARGRLKMADAVPILRSIARALDAAHSKGIAHRDLKPENIFLAHDADGIMFPKLLDFGIAKLLGSSSPQEYKTRTGAPMGTPAYMSPEQCRGRDVDHRTDIYAFGIVCYQMLTGEVPFDGEDYMEILLKQIGEEPAPPSARNGLLPETVDQGVLWMLAKDPASRPPNLVTAVRALEDAAVAAGIPVPAGPAPTGVYSSPTSQPMPAQKTPAAVSPLLAGGKVKPTSQKTTRALATAPTLDGRDISEDLAAVQAPGSSRGLLYAALAVVVVGGGVIAAMALGGKEPSKVAAVPAQASAAPPRAAATDATVAQSLADAAPVAPTFVTVRVEGPPDGTEVYGPAGLLGVAPGEIQLPFGAQEIQLVFKADGYRAKTAQLLPNEDGTLMVELARKKRVGRTGKTRGKGGRGGKGGKGGRDTIENPFE